MQKLFFLFSVLTIFTLGKVNAQGSDINQRNETLFDQTVDKLNFRTIEYVYDRKFPRKKFPANMTDFKTRKTFDDFEGNAAFKKLFMNYNDVSEKFKNKYGKGKNDLASFEKALGDILINKDFEFFISSLTKDDKIQLIRSLQQINKKGIAQFVDAAGKPRGFFASDSVIDEKADPIVKPKNGESGSQEAVGSQVASEETDTAQAVINTSATPEEVFQSRAPRRDWLSWVALLFSIGALALAAAVKLKDIPELRAFVSNNFQKRGEGSIAVVKPTSTSEPVADPAMQKQLNNLVREVEGLYAQMDELLHKNSLLEQKLAEKQPKPYELPKTSFLEPEVDKPAPVRKENTYKNLEMAPAPAAEANSPVISHDAAPASIPTRPDSTRYTSLTVPMESQSENETTEAAPAVMYLNKPDRHGFFWNDDLTRSFVPNQSLFALNLTGNDAKKGTFELVTDAVMLKLALENQELYLSPVCDIQVENSTGQRLETVTPGTIILNGDQWVLVKKASLRVV